MTTPQKGVKRRPLDQLADDNNDVTKLKRSKNEEESSNNQTLKKRPGTIRRMVLKNFMCHSHLEVCFTSNINYVTGRNGSGKSAILTALVVGLGGKATITNRGNNLKSFIKAGKNSASVEIILHNQGLTAYKFKNYGEEIIISRNIAANGSGSYKIKSSKGTVISTSIKELRLILSNLRIQIDNPVCILNQDTSRNFLSSTDPKQKFLLFMRATQLDRLQQDYTEASNNLRITIQKHSDISKHYEELRSQMDVLREKLENHTIIFQLKEDLSLYQRELVWAQVRDLEDELKEQDDKCTKMKEEIQKIMSNRANKVQRLNEIKEKVNELQQSIVQLREAMQKQYQSQLDVQRILDELSRKCNEKTRQRQLLFQSIEWKNKERESLQREINSFESRLSKYEQEKLKKSNELLLLEKEKCNLHSIIETTHNDIFQLKSNVNKRDNEEEDLRKQIDEVNGQCYKIQDNIRMLKNKSGNSLMLYGKDIPRILDMIERNKGKFKHAPRGPLGAHIHIKDKKWALAVEDFLGPGLLQSFAVDNADDCRLLKDIISKCWSQQIKSPMIIISKFFFKVHNISQHSVHAVDGCISIFDALEVTDPVVANCLIDQMGIESVLLIPTTQKAIELMSNMQRVPRNCRQAVTVTGDKYFPDPNYRTYASQYRTARYLEVNTVELINDYTSKLKTVKENLGTLQNQIKVIVLEKNTHQAMLQDLYKKANTLKQSMSDVKGKMEQISVSITESATITDMDSMKNDLNELQDKIDREGEMIKNIETEIEEISGSIQENKNNLSKLKENSKELEERIVPLETQITDESVKKNELSINQNHEKKRLEELKQKIETIEENISNKRNIIDEESERACELGERPDEIRNVVVIADLIYKMQRKINKVESQVESPEETRKKYDVVTRKCQETSEIITHLDENVKELKIGVNKGNRNYKYTKDYFITLLNYNFSKILEFRQYKGSVDINMGEQTLSMEIVPRQGSQTITSTSNLSGGERSFSTVAFLYSLWQCMDFPFYFLDEFDVFMDTVNRSKVMDILIHHAKNRPELQFVFLTPQDVSFIKDKDVAIHCLENPERRN